MQKILGDLEEKIMKVIWASKEPLKPAEVQAGLKNKYAYTTIMTIMSRLVEKKILKRSQKGNTYYYQPVKGKASFAKPKLRLLFKNLFNSYGEIAISQFIDTLEDIDPEELKKLQKYIEKKKNESE
jgi:predicted transcriptional regulator